MTKQNNPVPESEGPALDTTLKYQYLIDTHHLIAPCPNRCKPIESLAYRFVGSEVLTQDDFLPNELEENPTFYPRKPFTDSQKCMRCAISLFNTAENALGKLEFLSVKLQDKFANKLIAVGNLELNDGIGTEPNDRGHFSFYEYKNSTIYLKFAAFKHAI